MVSVFYSSSLSANVSKIAKGKNGSWVHATNPSQEELQKLADDYDLDVDLLKDALDLYESPRVETHKNQIYVFTRYYYDNKDVINATEPVLFIYHPDCLITLLRVDSGIFKNLTLQTSTTVTTQKTKLLLQLFFQINNSYHGQLNKVTRYILQVRSELKKTNIKNEALLALLEIEDDLNEILSALQPHASVLRTILNGKSIKLFEGDKDLIEDLSLSTNELIELVKPRLKTLANIRQAHEALATSDLNRTFKRLTSISIFLMVPAIMAGIYGMNILLPFQNNINAFWIVIGLTVLVTSGMWWYFNRKHWL